MRIGICGGTFDPLHLGHEQLVRSVLAQKLVDRVIVIPAGKPPHKQQKRITPGLYRYEMARSTFADDPRILVSDYELLKPQPSYTLDTAEQIARDYPDSTIFLVYGSDVLFEIENWHQSLTLLKKWPLLIAERAGIESEQNQIKAEQLRLKTGVRISFFAIPALLISASQIRDLADRGEDIDQFVPDCVNLFIKKNALYRWQKDLDQIPPANWSAWVDLEIALWHLLTPKRLLHTLNVLRYALHLAIRHGVDYQKVALAALLHDCAKCLPAATLESLLTDRAYKDALPDSLLHGPAGAVVAAKQFAIEDEDVLKAISCHTTGCAAMNKLEQIIYIADKAEPARDHPDLPRIRELAEHDLAAATLLALEGVEQALIRKNLKPQPQARAAKRDLIEQMRNRTTINLEED